VKKEEKSKKFGPSLSFKKVNDLPLGSGAGAIVLKNGKRVEIESGRIVKKTRKGNSTVVLETLRKTEGTLPRKENFSGPTLVIDWKQDDDCAFCPMPQCNGICDETLGSNSSFQY